MQTFCLVVGGVPSDRMQEFDVPPALAPKKDMVWLPYRREALPAFDPATERLSPYIKAIVGGEVVDERTVIAMKSEEQEEANRRFINPREFMNRINRGKQHTIFAAAQADPSIARWLSIEILGGPIDLNNPEVEAGIDVLIASGPLKAADKTALLA